MAHQPYNPVPTVEPSGPAPQMLRIDASPASFGGLIAQGEQRFGAGAEQAGANLMGAALKVQAMNNEADARGASNKFMADAGKAWAQYGTLEGKEAVDAYPKFVDTLNALQQQHADGLGSPQARNDFLNASSYMVNRLTLMSSTHAAEQQRAYWKQSHVANIANTTQFGVLMQNDPQTIDVAANSIADSVEQLGQMSGWDPERVKAETANTLGKYYRTVIEAQAARDPAAAQATFERAKTRMDGASIATVEASLRAVRERSEVAGAVQRSFGGGGSAPEAPELQRAIRGQEGSRSDQTSVNGARGAMQVTPAFFKQYAAPGENFDNEADRVAVANRGINELNAKYGGDPARVAVAYFSGESNVAPAGSPTPWIADKKDGNGTPTSAYVAGVQSRLSGTNPVPPRLLDDMAVIQRAEQETAGMSPEMRQRVMDGVYSHLQQQHLLVDRAVAAQAKERHEATQAAFDEYVPKIMGDPTSVNIRSIADDPRLDGPTKWRLNEMLKVALSNDTKVSAVSHATAVSLIADMRRPEGDPLRTTDLTPLFQAYQDGKLTNADFNFVQTQFKELQTPEGQRLNTVTDNFLRAVKPTIDKANPLMGTLDMTGGTEFFRLQQDIAARVAQYRKEGKNPFDLFDPSKPEYIGKPEALAPYQKSIPESVSEFTARMQRQAATSSLPQAKADEGSAAAVSRETTPPLAPSTAPMIWNAPGQFRVPALPFGLGLPAEPPPAPEKRPSLDQIFSR